MGQLRELSTNEVRQRLKKLGFRLKFIRKGGRINEEYNTRNYLQKS